MVDLEAGTRLIAYVAGAASTPLLLTTSGGTGFACQLGDLVSRQRAGKQFLTLETGWEPLRPVLVDPATDDRIACASESGRLLVFPASEIKAQAAGGRGVILLGLDEAEKMVGAVTCGGVGVVVSGTAPRSGKETQIALSRAQLVNYAGSRARKGTVLSPRIRVTALAKAPAAKD
jgi:topoisomerase-4 subunit A